MQSLWTVDWYWKHIPFACTWNCKPFPYKSCFHFRDHCHCASPCFGIGGDSILVKDLPYPRLNYLFHSTIGHQPEPCGILHSHGGAPVVEFDMYGHILTYIGYIVHRQYFPIWGCCNNETGLS